MSTEEEDDMCELCSGTGLVMNELQDGTGRVLDTLPALCPACGGCGISVGVIR